MLTAGRPINWRPERRPDAVRAEVQRQASLGVDYIEVYARMTPGLIRAVIAARTPLDPTLIAYVTKFRGRDPRYRNGPSLRVAPREVRDTWRGALGAWTDDDF
jgi:hypothetical protein